MTTTTTREPLLIERILPEYDALTIQHVVVGATPAETYAAIERTDIAGGGLANTLSQLRDLPNRVERWWRHEPEPLTGKRVTFRDLEEAGWVKLAEQPRVELVSGLVGKFWQRDYGVERVSPEEFAGFDRPGFAKVAVSLSVRPYGEGRTLLTYETRTATTDEEARRRFRRYWRVVGIGANLLMRTALRLIKEEAERGGS